MTKKLSAERRDELLEILRERFESNTNRHPEMTWNQVAKHLLENPSRLWSLNEMEATGGEPDVVDIEKLKNTIVFVDCAKESPSGRRSLCYDQEALEARKLHKPEDSAVNKAQAMGVELLTENQYFKLQQFGSFDTKTSSWLYTPPEVRRKGGAIFGDWRYGRVFVSHNGADSYYAARGFRTLLQI